MAETTGQIELVKYEYGAMSSRYSLMAPNKLVAYATMVYHYDRGNHLVAIYEPESSKQDQWLNPFGKVSERLDEIFGGENAFDLFVDANIEEIKKCIDTINQIC